MTFLWLSQQSSFDISTLFIEYLNFPHRKALDEEISKFACLDQTVIYFDRNKLSCFASSHLEKNFSSRKKSFFFQFFQLYEMKTIDNIFAFNIICFSVYTKFISILLVLDLVVFDLVSAFVLYLDGFFFNCRYENFFLLSSNSWFLFSFSFSLSFSFSISFWSEISTMYDVFYVE
jgi:hypothetical protein